MTKFRDLAIGDRFTFRDDRYYGYFHATCTKVSTRCYTWLHADGRTLKGEVGAINATVVLDRGPVMANGRTLIRNAAGFGIPSDD